MAASISIFVEPRCTLLELVEAVRVITGLQFDRVEVGGAQLFRGMMFGCLIDIFDEHGLVDDQGIAFSEYAFEVDFSMASRPLYGEHAEKVVDLMPFATAQAISEKFLSRCPVVGNLQRLLTVFLPSTSAQLQPGG